MEKGLDPDKEARERALTLTLSFLVETSADKHHDGP